MKFATPCGSETFEIPDDWWQFCGMETWRRSSDYYPYSYTDADVQNVEVVPVGEIEPPRRATAVALLKKYKLVPVLLAFQSPECALPAIQVERADQAGGPLYTVTNGFHRYFASIAVGYPCIPVRVYPRMPA